MSTVFFKITDQQTKEVESFMDSEGYTNKAEFFRFLLKFFKYHQSPERTRLESATERLGNILRELKKKGKLNKSLDEQLADV